MILGAILAGGQSRRFGSDKAVARFAGRTLIEHAIAALAPHVDAIVVCGRDSAPAGATPVADWPEPGLGPLGGLCGALRHAAHHGFDRVLTLGCDTPLLPPDAVPSLIANCPACLAQSPVAGCWPAALADVLTGSLARGGDRSIRRWATSVGVTAIDTEAIANLNTPDDLARLRDHAGPS